MLGHVDWRILSDVSEILVAFIFLTKLQPGDEGSTILRNVGTCRSKRRKVSEDLNLVVYSPCIIRQQPALYIITTASASLRHT